MVEFTNLTALWYLISYLSEHKLILWRSKSNFQCFCLIKLDLQISSLDDGREDVSYHIQEVLHLKSLGIATNKQKHFLLIKALFVCFIAYFLLCTPGMPTIVQKQLMPFVLKVNERLIVDTVLVPRQSETVQERNLTSKEIK